MIHNYTEFDSNNIYAVNLSGFPEGYIIAQLDNADTSVRVPLTSEEARHFARLLSYYADLLDGIDKT